MSIHNVTITLTRQALETVRLLAARLSASVGLVGREEAAYQHAQRQAMALLDEGFHMGGVIPTSRDQWHE